MNSDQVKTEVLKILVAFDNFCTKHDIKYIIGYGTMLGAIRHKGFIPWDDDIDVVLTTKEYYKFRKIARELRFLDDEKRYRVMIPGDDDFCYSFMKIVDTHTRVKEKNIDSRYNIGLFVDVFRVDYWPESKLVEFFALKKSRLILKINEILIRGNLEPNSKLASLDKVLKPVDLVLKLLGIRSKDLCLKLEKTGSKRRKSRYMGNMMSGYGRSSERLSAEIFDNYILAEFEGLRFPVPKNYDGYLKSIYGDYMKLPDVSKRIGHEYDVEKIN